MNKADPAKWDRFRADLDKGLKKGMLIIGDSGVVVNTKKPRKSEADDMEYRILGLKLKAHQQMSHLGARVYSFMSTPRKDPCIDERVKDITARLRRYETEIAEMEKHLKAAGKRLGKRS